MVSVGPDTGKKSVLARAVAWSLENSLSWIGPIVLLALWEALVRAGILDEQFFTPPSGILLAMGKMLASGELLKNTSASLYRVFGGFLFGSIPGLFLGVAMGLVPVIRWLLQPIMAGTYPIPKSAILPLIMVFFGLGETSKLVTLAISVCFPVWINTMAGVLTIPQIHLDVGKNFGARNWQFYRTVALPGALPAIFAGLKQGFGTSLLLIPVVEMVGAKAGLGYQIWRSWQTLSMPTLYVSLITISLLGLVSTMLLDEAERRVIPWNQR